MTNLGDDKCAFVGKCALVAVVGVLVVGAALLADVVLRGAPVLFE